MSPQQDLDRIVAFQDLLEAVLQVFRPDPGGEPSQSSSPRPEGIIPGPTGELSYGVPFLWRLKFEQRLRHDPTFRGSADFQSDRQIARKIPANVNHLPVDRADDDGLIVCSCEHAGMLAAARWIADQRWSWGQEGIMDLDDPAVRALVQAPPETNDDISNSDVR